MRELLRGYLDEIDWSDGATKDRLLLHLAGRDETLRTMINQYVVDGLYQTPDDILNVIPAQAWQDAQGDQWRGAPSSYADDAPDTFRESPVGQAAGDASRAGESSPTMSGFGPAAEATAEIAAEAVEASKSAALEAWSDIANGFTGEMTSRRIVPVALSAMTEGFGQAYNRQPVKAAALLAAGLGLSTASGLNTWLARRVFGAKGVTIGSDRIRPGLLALWAACYAYNLWDAWAGAETTDAKRPAG